MDCLPDLTDITTHIHPKFNKKANLHRAIARDNSTDLKIINRVEAECLFQTVNGPISASIFLPLKPRVLCKICSHIQGLIDLDQVIVITGFAEVGPWGSSCTIWEMEARGEFPIEGCIELAWIMGFIKHFDSQPKDGSLYVGWVDSKTNEPVDDKEVKGRYEKDILLHAGVLSVSKTRPSNNFSSNHTL